ncbi:hypothetical protein SLEP1_g29461 [Rubroshorea leprosula]|uniref:Reverse transcriptase/retrotransposon-derived protein RNase H-like domain-containing protein n=1 Tax=Rubroshorea leprosula TaxID=152421 RepID=A0AAV5K600_9ROSI|nr:hypothetical protein SLEP1_g29461 [Rubroshorea leprosula]
MQQQFDVFQVVLAQLLAQNNLGDPLINLLNPTQQPLVQQQEPPPQPLPDDVTQRLNSLEKMVAKQRGAPILHHNTTFVPHPLNTNITLEPYLAGFKIPQLETYDGTKDPDDHLHAFYFCMQAQNASNALMCKIFLYAQTWYYSLPLRPISFYVEMASTFATKFSNRRFNDVVLEVSSFDQVVGIATIIQSLKHERFKDSLIKHPSTTFNEVNDRSLRFITVKEYTLSQKPVLVRNQNSILRKEGQSRKQIKIVQNRGLMLTSMPSFGRSNSIPPQQTPSKAPVTWTSFNLPSLKSELESLAQKGLLNKYIRRTKQPKFVREQGSQPQGSRTIEGLKVGGLSSKQWKLYVKEVKQQNRAQKQKFDDTDWNDDTDWKNQPITFTPIDFDGVISPHNDPLVTFFRINNCEVQHVLVDTGSAPDIMYYHCFESLRLDPTLLQRYNSPIYGFNNQPVQVKGVLTLNVAFRSGRTYVTSSIRFLVLKMASSINVVIGRPTLMEIQAVVSQSYLCMKFPIPMGIATLKGNQKIARHCYITLVTRSLKEKDHMSKNARKKFMTTSSYHQVPMAPGDKEKTSFYARDEIYCYVMMPFGLKNAVKSWKAKDHLADLDETFNNLRKNQMRLNPAKCIFGVESRKFLGFMVSSKGIEVNPEKIKVKEEMEPSKSVNDVQRLTGRVVALHRFVSKSANRCLPFFKIMRSSAQKDESGKQKKFEWSPECEAAFDELKSYLSSPSLLIKAIDEEILYLYLGISDEVISFILVKEKGKQQKPIYYTSRVLHGAKKRYSIAEKAILAIVTLARKLRPYFQSHPIVVLTNQPLWQIL